MTQPIPSDTVLGPTRNGSLWPYVVLPLIGAGIMIYLTVDLYALLSRSGAVHPNDWPILYGMGGIVGLFCLLAVALWYAPWSWAHLHLTDTDFTIEVTGLNARKATVVPWARLTRVSLVHVPRGASFYRLDLDGQRPITIRTLAFTADPPELLAAFDAAARRAGYHLSGKPLCAPLIGVRRWSVVAYDPKPAP